MHTSFETEIGDTDIPVRVEADVEPDAPDYRHISVNFLEINDLRAHEPLSSLLFGKHEDELVERAIEEAQSEAIRDAQIRRYGLPA